MSGYVTTILSAASALAVTDEEARVAEQIMRDSVGGTLDHLRRGEFDSLAREAVEAARYFRAEEPDVYAMLVRCTA